VKSKLKLTKTKSLYKFEQESPHYVEVAQSGGEKAFACAGEYCVSLLS